MRIEQELKYVSAKTELQEMPPHAAPSVAVGNQCHDFPRDGCAPLWTP